MNSYIEVLFEDISEKVSEWMRIEWKSSNLDIFGREIAETEWRKPLAVLLYEKTVENLISDLIGVARCSIVGSTVRVSQLLVKKDFRRKKGIGSLIIKKIEDLCHQNGWHKIRLSTSEKHRNLAFYKKLGFKVEATLKEDAFGFTWFILSKFIKLY